MHRLRNARLLARFLLAWFALTLCAAIASPMVKPVQTELICTAGVMKLLVKSDGGVKEQSTHTLDCPLCANIGSPPPAIKLAVESAQPLSYALRSIPSARIAALTAAPLPARGPPSLS